jgi:hypothetical protein
VAALILVRHCHGYLFWDQVSAGLLGILRICGSTLARVMPDPQVACDIVHPFCWLCRRPLSAMMSPPFERASSALTISALDVRKAESLASQLIH